MKADKLFIRCKPNILRWNSLELIVKSDPVRARAIVGHNNPRTMPAFGIWLPGLGTSLDGLQTSTLSTPKHHLRAWDNCEILGMHWLCG
jgi:hypothetical protein